MSEHAPRWYCTACGAVSVRPDRCAECGSTVRLDVLGSIPPMPPERGPNCRCVIPPLGDLERTLPEKPSDLQREADRIVALWSNVERERDEQVARARAMLVGKEVDVPFAPTSGWAVDPSLQRTPGPRWHRRMVMAVHQAGRQVDRVHPNGERERHALRLTYPAPRALVLGIDPKRPIIWVPLPWLRIEH